MDSQTILIREINYSTYKLYELTNLCVDTFSMCLSQVHNEQGWHGGARNTYEGYKFYYHSKTYLLILETTGTSFCKLWYL